MPSKAAMWIILLGLSASWAAQADLLVYEPFDYSAGSDVNTPLNGGLGFSDAWTPGQQGGVITVYDETAATVINNNAGGEIAWDGVVDNVPTGPVVGSRFISTGPGGTADRITANRILSQSAGALAGTDKILWASVVWHQKGSNYGRHIGFTLGTDGLSNRSQNMDTSGAHGAGVGDGMGVGGSINTLLVTPVAFDNGAKVVQTTTGATAVSTSLDNLVVLKFVFGATDTVSAFSFTESDTLSETTFNTSAVSASYALDENTLNILSFSQSRGQEAIDEIRLGDTFDDVISGELAPREPLEITGMLVEQGSGRITLTWKSNPGEYYGLYWSETLATFLPGIEPAVPAHGSANRTTYGPFENPAPHADHLFFRVGPADLEDPTLDTVWGSGTEISLVFSEAMDAASATEPGNYAVARDGGGAVTVIGTELSPDGKTVTLTTGSALALASSFTVTINNLADRAGRLLGDPTLGNFRTWDNFENGIKVFILAGQSNMVGHGKSEKGVGDVDGAIGGLRYMAVHDDDGLAPHYRDLLVNPGDPAGSAWATRDDVQIWWRDSDVTAPRAVHKGDLGIGFAQSRNPAWFGPEYAFGWVMGDHYAEPVLIIKTSWGGKSLHVDYRPPSAVAARGGVVGPYYTGMIDYVRDVLSNLQTEYPAAQFPAWAALNYRYQIAGFGWHQGWNDRVNATYAAAYEENLVDLINDLRTEFGRPDLPVTIGTTGMVPQDPKTPVELAQLAVADPAQHPEFAGTVFTVDTQPFWRDASVSPSGFGYHWNHNGETHFLVGDAMGRKLVPATP